MAWPEADGGRLDELARPAGDRQVPATSANLGPGFDALGLALGLHDVVEARVTPGGVTIEVTGAGEDAAAAGEEHLVVRAMRAAFGALDGQPPGIGLRCANAIPQGYGLGSSAGAIVAGLLAARALAPPAASAWAERRACCASRPGWRGIRTTWRRAWPAASRSPGPRRPGPRRPGWPWCPG